MYFSYINMSEVHPYYYTEATSKSAMLVGGVGWKMIQSHVSWCKQPAEVGGINESKEIESDSAQKYESRWICFKLRKP